MTRWHWNTAWPVVRDVGITGTGLVTVWAQLLLWAFRDRAPDTGLMAVGLALLFPAAQAHVRAVMGGPSAGSSSESSSPPSLPSSSPLSSPQPETSGGPREQ